MFRKTLLAATMAAAIFVSTSAMSATVVDFQPTVDYVTGSIVRFNDELFIAKWWVGANTLTPASVDEVANEWDTPWKRYDGEVEGPGPGPGPGPEPGPGDGPYDATRFYEAGTKVIFADQLYIAKWYVNPGQSPADIDPALPWNSPWKLYTGDEGPVEPPLPPPPLDAVFRGLPDLRAEEAHMLSTASMQQIIHSVRTLDNATVEKVVPGAAGNPSNVRRVEGILPESEFEFLFPYRDPAYRYTGFLQAVAKYPAFCGDYDDGRDADAICRTSLATMFAHFGQETGGHDANDTKVPEWRQALVWVREMNLSEGFTGGYGLCDPALWQGFAFPCAKLTEGPDAGKFKNYFGRGAKQLSYNYNYGPFSQSVYGNKHTLLQSPELVADTWLNFASAVFFFVYPQPPKPSMLHVIDGTWVPNEADKADNRLKGFGTTTLIINGGVECGGSKENAQSLNRMRYHGDMANHLKATIPAGEPQGCAGMKEFTEASSAATKLYWVTDYSWVEGAVGGLSYKCQLTAEQTPFSALVEHDYEKCVQHYFPNVTTSPL
ncbi:chitodextrinase [Luteibacter sp. Sphag1AF]|uniref:glycoside hydrolase family 19 protein n=1 Tax=Luteibacter sp. Sphag1AF TaxID=2587031 RepID=UPI001620DAE9|nr:glycoside hydrolase family 19 protein [Luteibacter sp. Sphag1AF]MBB3228763.1 chitodextrinase [Luteibacter sp. Sphag1AF]